MAPALFLKNITIRFGNTLLLDGAELSVSPGDRLALVGRNGSGKSTLLKIAAGLIEADSGERFAQPGATIRYLAQEPSLAGYATTLDYVEAGLAPGDDPARAYYLLGNLGLTGQEDPARLSGGEARRAALARVLAPRPDILLLDEPTNHLDLPAIEWLEGELKAMRSALVLISHDRRFLENLSRAVVWLDRGQTKRMEQGFGAFEDWRDATLEAEEIERHKQGRKIAQELDWLTHGRSGRRKRNQGRLARLRQLRQQSRAALKVMGSVKMEAMEAAQSGTKVIDAKGVAKSFGMRTIITGFNLRIHKGDRIGIVGPNGAGKSTLLKMLIGELKPDAGNVKLGVGIEMARLDQNRDALDPEETLANTLTAGSGSDTVFVGGKPRHVMSYMQDFLFTPAQARTPVRILSGGERARLLLARLFAKPSNFLVLDEPTNDLDLETLDLLEEVISDYPGTALIVSHDRDFLDRTVNQIVAAEGDGVFRVYAGGYTDMLAQKAPPKEAKADMARQAEKKERPARAPSAAKMNFADAHALKTLPAQIEAAAARIAALQHELSDSTLYAGDPKRFSRLSAELAKLSAARDVDEERWLALEMQREELEG